MVGKYYYISVLAEMTAADIVKNENEWIKFLATAARLYKYPFNEQMLIYAQRPDATACASLETWNEKMNCWVNRGAKGIALIDTESETVCICICRKRVHKGEAESNESKG